MEQAGGGGEGTQTGGSEKASWTGATSNTETTRENLDKQKSDSSSKTVYAFNQLFFPK